MTENESPLTQDVTHHLIEKAYIERCKKITEENSANTELVNGYNQNIANVKKCKTLTELMKAIQTDGDFDEDVKGLHNFIFESLIQREVS